MARAGPPLGGGTEVAEQIVGEFGGGGVALSRGREVTRQARSTLNYIADPDDIARAALFLLSDESRWTTGTVFPCEGGVTAR